MLMKKINKTLEKIKEEINKEYGFHEGIPRINYGLCGVFAQIFFKKWNPLKTKRTAKTAKPLQID